MDSMLLHSKSTKSSKRPEVREKFVNLLMERCGESGRCGIIGMIIDN